MPLELFPQCDVHVPMDTAQINVGLVGEAPSRAAGKLITMDIQRDTSPELAIKIAYDFGRKLRTQANDGNEFSEVLASHVAGPFADHSLLPYVIAGFTAGYHFEALPWRRQIEAKLAESPSH